MHTRVRVSVCMCVCVCVCVCVCACVHNIIHSEDHMLDGIQIMQYIWHTFDMPNLIHIMRPFKGLVQICLCHGFSAQYRITPLDNSVQPNRPLS